MKTESLQDPSPPAPLPNRSNHLGGIESLILDGTIWWFGFDYSEDLVLSPLIDDIDRMARFASRYMLQRDGSHDEAYWRELAGYESELCAQPEDRVFDSGELAAMMTLLRHARDSNDIVAGFGVSYHLRYLLASAGDWAEAGGFEQANDAIAVIRGEKPVPGGSSIAAVAMDLQGYLAALVAAAPGNWATLFAVLRA